MAKPNKIYTDEQEDKCIKLFFRTELRPNEDIINNTDTQIAKEVGIPKHTVSNIITKHLNKKYDNYKSN